MKRIFLMVLLAGLVSSGAMADKPAPRKVPCPAECNAGEVADSTQQCVHHDKELYKVDGIGCKKYETVCYCKPGPKPLPPKTVL